MTSQQSKVERFRTLHSERGIFIVPNPWDAGSARVLAGLGFQALTTSSSAAGVKRISVAGSLYRASVQGLLDAAREIQASGTFDYVEGIVTTPELNKFLG